MRLRHILEYEDHEIEGLLGDLETIGLSTKGAYSLWVAVPSFTFPSGVVGNLKLPLALGNPFWSNGSLREDRNLILSSLREGRFTRPPSFEKEHLALKKVDSDQEWEWTNKEDAERSQKTLNFLSLESLQSFFDSVDKSKGLLRTLDSLREKILTTLHGPGGIQKLSFNVGKVVLVYGRPEDEDLLSPPSGPLSSPLQEKVIIEDLLALEEGRLTDFRVFLKDHVDWDGGTDL